MYDVFFGICGIDYNFVFFLGQIVVVIWDCQLMYCCGYVIGKEVKGKGINVIFGFVVGFFGWMFVVG